MTIVENILMGRYDKRGCLIDYRTLTEKTNRLTECLGIHYNPDARVRQYSVVQRQLIEIMKALSYNPSIIVLGESMAVLILDGAKMPYGIVRKLKQEGVPIILISHRMEDVYVTGNRIYVLEDGRYSGETMVKDTVAEDIIEMMIGRNTG